MRASQCKHIHSTSILPIYRPIDPSRAHPYMHTNTHRRASPRTRVYTCGYYRSITTCPRGSTNPDSKRVRQGAAKPHPTAGSIRRARTRACRGYCEYRRDTRWPTRMYPVGMGRAVRVADPHRSSSGAAWSAIVQHLTLHQQHHDSCALCECASTQEQRGAKDRRCSNCVALRHSSCNGGARCFRGVSTHCW